MCDEKLGKPERQNGKAKKGGGDQEPQEQLDKVRESELYVKTSVFLWHEE